MRVFKSLIFFNKNKFLFDKFAVFIKNEHHIIKIHGVLHIYKDGVYTSNEDEIRRTMIKYVPNLKKQDRNEILDYINLLVRKDTNNCTCASHSFQQRSVQFKRRCNVGIFNQVCR